MIHPGLSVVEFGAIVSSALKSGGFQAVLSGGSVVTIYAGNEWESLDLDFVVERVDRRRIEAVLVDLGFKRESVRAFSHPNHSHWIEILSAPVTLGDEYVQEWTTLDTSYGTLEILTPAQCVKDRLAGFYHSFDRQSLDQAVAVFVKHNVSLDEIVEWSQGERASPEKLREFVDAAERARAKRKLGG